MVIGMTLMKSATAYLSPTFARGGLSATFARELLMVGTSGTLDIDIEHKNLDDTAFTTAGSFAQLTAAGIGTIGVSALKEQVRFRYSIAGAQAWSFVHFNMLAPAWRPY